MVIVYMCFKTTFTYGTQWEVVFSIDRVLGGEYNEMKLFLEPRKLKGLWD